MHPNKLTITMGVTFAIIMSISSQNSELGQVFAQTENFTLSDAKVKKTNSTLHANLTSNSEISQDGSKGAMGIAIISEKGFESIIASTTHGGVLDSEVQKNTDDPAWHNHFVKLAFNNSISSKCGNNPEVEELTFQSPGNVTINYTNMQISEIPHKFDAINSLDNNSLSFEQGNSIDKVVTFKLQPHFDAQNEVEVVCVTDIQPVANMKKE
jgi:hypothetical protein